MDWFERITGFPEGPYEETQAALSVVDGRLRRRGAGYSYGVGALSLPSLARGAKAGAKNPTATTAMASPFK
ncbi:hypothetical protein [Methylobacterium sp. Leaf87]|uniref:hypothetical protein n=1 Tax=Methylobacterium sp. Leaf87 TaxID=1736243 RepID=UPI000B1258B6|nr:hypothetical protein [Methylobacterium sp. Leaf87]